MGIRRTRYRDIRARATRTPATMEIAMITNVRVTVYRAPRRSSGRNAITSVQRMVGMRASSPWGADWGPGRPTALRAPDALLDQVRLGQAVLLQDSQERPVGLHPPQFLVEGGFQGHVLLPEADPRRPGCLSLPLVQDLQVRLRIDHKGVPGRRLVC